MFQTRIAHHQRRIHQHAANTIATFREYILGYAMICQIVHRLAPPSDSIYRSLEKFPTPSYRLNHD